MTATELRQLIAPSKTNCHRDIREVSLACDSEHARIARRHNGTPIFHVGNDGKERRAIRTDDGNILIDYRSELRYLTDCMADFLQTPISARH